MYIGDGIGLRDRSEKYQEIIIRCIRILISMALLILVNSKYKSDRNRALKIIHDLCILLLSTRAS